MSSIEQYSPIRLIDPRIMVKFSCGSGFGQTHLSAFSINMSDNGSIRLLVQFLIISIADPISVITGK